MGTGTSSGYIEIPEASVFQISPIVLIAQGPSSKQFNNINLDIIENVDI